MAKTIVNPNEIMAAIDTPDDDVSAVRSFKPGSLLSQIKMLGIQECCAKVIPVATEITVHELAEQGTEMRRQIRNAVGSSIAAAKKITGHEYDVEVTNAMTTASRLYLIAIITRTS